MKSTERKYYISIYGTTATSDDMGGAVVAKDASPADQVWASKDPIGGSRALQYRQITHNHIYEFTFGKTSFVPDRTCLITHDSEDYDIHEVIEDDYDYKVTAYVRR